MSTALSRHVQIKAFIVEPFLLLETVWTTASRRFHGKAVTVGGLLL
jgi:hypothetical protein